MSYTDVFNVVEEFGADPTGSRDSTAEEQAALDAAAAAGGRVFYPPGTYLRTGGPVLIPVNLEPQHGGVAIVIEGASTGSVTFSLEGTATTGAFEAFSFAASSPGDTLGSVRLTGFTVDGHERQCETEQGRACVINTAATEVNVVNVEVDHVRTVGIGRLSTTNALGWRNVRLTPHSTNPEGPHRVVEGISIHHCEFNGGNTGVLIGVDTGSNLPFNIEFADIYVGFLAHAIASPPTIHTDDSHVEIGKSGWSTGRGIVIEHVYGINSGDVGIECDTAATVRDCLIENAFNRAYLAATFTVSGAAEPVLSRLASRVPAGETTLPLTATAGFQQGDRIAIYGPGTSENEVFTITSIAGDTVTLASKTQFVHTEDTVVQVVADMSQQRFVFSNCRGRRTVEVGNGGGGYFSIQNVGNVLPIGEVINDNGKWERTSADTGESGEVLDISAGLENIPTGNPDAARIRGLRAVINGVRATPEGNVTILPIFIVAYGPDFPLEIEGEISYEADLTLTEPHFARGALVAIRHTVAMIDLDVTTSFRVNETGAENLFGIEVNGLTGGRGGLGGRIRHVARHSQGGEAPQGVALGEASGYGSPNLFTTTREAVEPHSTVIPVASTTDPLSGFPMFVTGQTIVVGAGATPSEILTVEGVHTGAAPSITVVSLGETPGTVNSYAAGAKVAVMRGLVIADCDWTELGTSAHPIHTTYAPVLARVRTHGNVYGQRRPAVPITPAPSTKATQILTDSQGIINVTGGVSVSAVEWSTDGVSYVLVASTTGVVFPVSSGDFLRLTYSGAPSVDFYPAKT